MWVMTGKSSSLAMSGDDHYCQRQDQDPFPDAAGVVSIWMGDDG